MTYYIDGLIEEDEDESERKKRTKILADEEKLAKIQKRQTFTSEYMYNFKPLITADEYILLNSAVAKNFGKTTAVKSNRSPRLDYGLLHNKVICDYCDVPMQFQHPPIRRGKNTGKRVISFYCRNKACYRYDKEDHKKQGIKLANSIRGKYVLAGIEWQLRHLNKESERAYRMYIDVLEQRIASDRAILQNKLSQAKQALRENEKQYARYQAFQLDNPAEYKKHHDGKLEHHQELMNYYSDAVEDNKAKIKELDTELPSESEFYELTRSKVLDLLNTDDIIAIDAICREFVTNLRAGDDAVSVIKLNPPYDLMVDIAEISRGRGERTRTFDLRVPNAAR